MNIAEFYAEDHFRDPFGQERPGTNDHRGLDVAGWAVGTLVPAWAAGNIVTSEYNSALGWVVVADTMHGYAGVSHLQSKGAPVGAFVEAGQPWGLLGDSGRLSQGPHAHLTLSPTSRHPWEGTVIDPTPYIRAARNTSSPAGGGGTIITIESEEDEMKFLYVDDDGAGRPIWVLLNVSSAKFISTYSQSKANGWASVWGNARPTPRQEFLNAIDAIQKTK